ncbi:hypothetical protein LCGC14_1933490 [marine sediment metagenome]|uniref:6-carboxy-5,6,7,8-tetrahydropterin synthase n=1 Tax=marine sediment metagenome TaxID=412755 RepID=A0A0F9IJY1_9ZZZZ
MYRIRKEFHFEAAHHLPNHDGKCREPHGHSYRFEVFVVGNMPLREAGHPKEGMLVDFGDLSAVAKEIIGVLDHTDLNESAIRSLPDIDVTTAESLARGLFEFFDAQISDPIGGIHIEKVRVWETANAYAEYEEKAGLDG